MSKLLEKMVNNRLVWLLESRGPHSSVQAGLPPAGFRKRLSTVDHLVRLENAIQDAFLARKHLVAVFFDLEKAYDMTWRYGILEKLHRWGFRGRLPLFVDAFLTDRVFRVRVGNNLSTSRPLENGVPQGSTISVTLFAIAINDVADCVATPIDRCLYVDDLAIFMAGDTIPAINRKLQEAINNVNASAEERGFRFSATKTACVHFCRKRVPHRDPSLFLKGQRIECANTFKFLGLTFDSALSFRPHIEELATRCKKALNIIKCMANINWGSEREILLRLYRSLVLSRLDYGCAVYAAARPSRLKVLESIHCSGIRFATGAFRTSPHESLCCESGIPPLRHRRNRFVLRYEVAVRSNPDHYNYFFFTNYSQHRRYGQRPTVTRPVCVRARKLRRSLDLQLRRMFQGGS